MPNIAPPFHNFFIDVINNNSKNRAPYRDKFGLWVIAEEINKLNTIKKLHTEHYNRALNNNCKFILKSILFTNSSHNEIIMPAEYDFYISEDGSICNDNMGDIFTAYYPSDLLGSIREVFINQCMEYTMICLLTIAFMHCKNVIMDEINPNKNYSAKYIKKYCKPSVRYHVLNVDPVKKILKNDGNIEHNGLKKALHICRGHFKDYRNGNGLFGKYKGLYWWEQHLSGDSSEGIVLKDYKINKVVR
jgi:hypothetical protein